MRLWRTTKHSCWIRRSDHPSRPRAKTSCFFSSFKTLAISPMATSLRGSQCTGRYFRWPFSGDTHWPVFWMIAPELRGPSRCCCACKISERATHSRRRPPTTPLWRLTTALTFTNGVTLTVAGGANDQCERYDADHHKDRHQQSRLITLY